MGRQYSSFVIRVWDPTEGETRVEVKHIQSGAHAKLDSLLAATVWLASQCGVPGAGADMEPPAGLHSVEQMGSSR